MAAAPPPFSPRDARRQAKVAWRAQRSAYRAQSQYWSIRSRPSFVGPLLLISAGVVALLLETGRLRGGTFWPWYARWWPSILVFIGLGLLLEYFADRRNPNAGRRPIGGIVWLIVLLSLAGLTSHATLGLAPWGERFSDSFGGDPEHWLSMLGEEHARDVTLALPLAADATLTIDNARGDVEVSPVTGSDVNEVRVEAHEVVHANSDSTARQELDAIRPQLVRHGLASASLTVAPREGAAVDLKVTVPAGIALILRTTHGDVAISGLLRNAEVNASHSDVKLDNMGGSVHLQMDHGDVIVHEVAGDLSIDGRADDVSVSGVKGRSLMNGDFFGDTRLENVSGQVHFHSSRTDLDVPKLGGEMTIDSGDLRMVRPSGGLRLTTRSKDIEITDLIGDAHIEDNNGDVNVASALPLGNLQLSDRTGSMTVTVPSNAGFTVHGVANQNDELSTDFALSTESSGGHKVLSGQVGAGGPHLELSTDHGDLALRRGGVHAPETTESLDRPEPPERPEAPDTPRRHLKAKGEAPQPSVQ